MIHRKDFNEAFKNMSNNLDLFISEVKGKKGYLMATDKWTVKEVLCHIVFWHTNYAANYKVLSLHEESPLLDGPGYKLNVDGVNTLKKCSITQLIDKLYKAQESLYESIVIHNVPYMTYKKNGRVYETQDFLHMVERHIHTHTQHVIRAKRK